MPLILTVFGTRPEIIKLAPVAESCRAIGLDVENLFTGQQRELGDQLLRCLDVAIHHHAAIMNAGQSVNALLAKAIAAVDAVLEHATPSAVIVQGDTTSALAGALAARFRQLPLVHVEAGLRTGDFAEPFPEELNRALISRIASLHCAPTRLNVENLIAEGVDPTNIVETGNPIVDAVARISAKLLPKAATSRLLETFADKHLIVATMHRRENFGPRLDGYLRALGRVVEANRHIALIFSIHPNPNVGDALARCLVAGERVALVPPLDYPDFLCVLRRARIIVSDSGGIQEEAASVGTQVLVVRSKTERPEALDSGVARLVADPDALEEALARELAPASGKTATPERNPFGEIGSADRIAKAIAVHLSGCEK